MTFPLYIPFGSLKLHPHLVFEMAAYAIAFRVYLLLRKCASDPLDDGNRWWMIAAAAMGAVVGSKIVSMPTPSMSARSKKPAYTSITNAT